VVLKNTETVADFAPVLMVTLFAVMGLPLLSVIV
jgi:hypothetical protein